MLRFFHEPMPLVIPWMDSSGDSGEGERVGKSIKHDTCARFLLLNARSLIPKMDALADTFESLLHLDFALVTETWFRGRKPLRRALKDIEGASGIRMKREQRRESKGLWCWWCGHRFQHCNCKLQAESPETYR